MTSYQDQIGVSLKEINEQANTIKELSRQIDSFRREKENAKRLLNETKISFNDEYAKIYDRMGRNEEALRVGIKGMQSELNTLKTSFGEASRIYDSLQRVKMDIEDLSKQLESYRGEIGDIAEQLRLLETSATMPQEERAKTLKKLVDRSKQLKSNMTEARGKLKTAEKRLEDSSKIK